jgi:hypothetical protein
MKIIDTRVEAILFQMKDSLTDHILINISIQIPPEIFGR